MDTSLSVLAPHTRLLAIDILRDWLLPRPILQVPFPLDSVLKVGGSEVASFSRAGTMSISFCPFASLMIASNTS